VVSALVAAVALIAGVMVLAQQPAPSPASVAQPLASPAPTRTLDASGTASGAVPTDVGRSDSSPSAAPAVDAPVDLRVPSVGLELGIVPVGVRDDGQMDVPDLVSRLGWYRFGPAPGAATGSAVLAAHVDSELGRAPMARVLDASVGDPVEVTTRAGVELRYRITSVERLSKHDLPLDSLFARDGEHVLRLVTCGGAWDAIAGAYEDNIVVTAALDAP
jgi:sortase (surface protein transpeptidase)